MKVDNLAPRGNLVAINIKKQDTSPGGIVIAGTASNDGPTREGYVHVKGPDAKDVSVGDYVIIPNFIGMDITIGETSCVMIYQDDILAVLE